MLRTVNLGLTEYRWCWDLQKKLFAQRAADACPDTLLLTEHHPVYTLGRTGDPNHVLAGDQELRESGIDLVAIDRGGDVTYHGPGQLVCYPILNLHQYYLDLHRYLRDLEEVVIQLLRHYGVRAERHPAYTGVWVDGDKVCAIGIRCTNWITMHGTALNVTTDLRAFDRIIPCGIIEKGVTSLERLLGRPVALDEVSALYAARFSEVFGVEAVPVAVAELLAQAEQPVTLISSTVPEPSEPLSCRRKS